LTYSNRVDDFYPVLEAGGITAGMILIFRYQGPKGAPGMPEVIAASTSLLFIFFLFGIFFRCWVLQVRSWVLVSGTALLSLRMDVSLAPAVVSSSAC
jgi:hypothetical protein